jgi:hypothetical protein
VEIRLRSRQIYKGLGVKYFIYPTNEGTGKMFQTAQRTI